jgi:hypothetical protein
MKDTIRNEGATGDESLPHGKSIAGRAEVLTFLTACMRGEETGRDRLRAAELLVKLRQVGRARRGTTVIVDDIACEVGEDTADDAPGAAD